MNPNADYVPLIALPVEWEWALMKTGQVLAIMILPIITAVAREVFAQTPLGRIGRPDDTAKVAVFLASDDSDATTGQVLHVNGGSYMP